jgi:hypothetical protein
MPPHCQHIGQAGFSPHAADAADAPPAYAASQLYFAAAIFIAPSPSFCRLAGCHFTDTSGIHADNIDIIDTPTIAATLKAPAFRGFIGRILRAIITLKILRH